jgi:RNA polymerase sigma-70 factor (ECF subfamily)
MSLRETVLEYYDREHIAIRRYLLFSGVTSDLAEDTVQEAFLRLQVHLERSGDRTNLRAWLYRVAHNLALHELQGARYRLSEPIENAERASRADDPAGTPEQWLLTKERGDRVRMAIEQLPEVRRQCLVMRAQGLRFREIAEVLGLSVSTAAEHVQRGLERVRELI